MGRVRGDLKPQNDGELGVEAILLSGELPKELSP